MMSNQDDQAAQHDEHHEEHGGTGLYISIFIALCCLTSLSFLTYFDFWRAVVPVGVSRVFMMGVSCTKAMLVIMFFMHLKWEANWKWVLTIPASIMAMFLMFMLVPDVGLRMNHASYERMIYGAEVPAEEEAVPHADDHDADDQEGHVKESHESGEDAEQPST
jgi:cytochrome c oxidase subunit 4